MDAAEALKTYALLGLPVGLSTGLLLALVAKNEDGWGGYGSFRRRAARLAHVCAVMLPVIAGVLSLLLAAGERAAGTASLGAGLWIGGGISLALALAATAWRPRLRLLLPIPALSVVAGSAFIALAHFAQG
jgi:hypothetical protein